MFSPFGEIISIFLAKDEQTGKSKGFGFVCYKDGESAQKAVIELNGKDGMYVGRALKKEDRAR